MPILKSSKKALKVSERRRRENLSRRNAYKDSVKKIKKEIAAGSAKNLSESLKQTKSLIDKASKTRAITKKKASRLKSRLAKNIVSQPNKQK